MIDDFYSPGTPRFFSELLFLSAHLQQITNTMSVFANAQFVHSVLANPNFFSITSAAILVLISIFSYLRLHGGSKSLSFPVHGNAPEDADLGKTRWMSDVIQLLEEGYHKVGCLSCASGSLYGRLIVVVVLWCFSSMDHRRHAIGRSTQIYRRTKDASRPYDGVCSLPGKPILP